MSNKKKGRGETPNIKWGICINTNGYEKDGSFHKCAKCVNKEKQAIRPTKDFVCEECGEPLLECAPPRPVFPWKQVLCVVAIVIVAAAAFLVFRQCRSTEPQPLGEPVIDSEATDSLPELDDTAAISETPVVVGNEKNDKGTKTRHDNNGVRETAFGMFDGDWDYDNNASIKVTRQHTFFLKNAAQSTITVYPGDRLTSCRIRDGILLSFQVVRANGERESILDVAEKLR